MQTNKLLFHRGEIRRKKFVKPRGFSNNAGARAWLICQTVGLFLLVTFQVHGQGKEKITDPTEIKTRTGVTYKSIRILKVAPDGLVVEFTPSAGGIGMTKIEFRDLPVDLQQKYGYDIEKATAYKTERAKEQAIVAARMWADYNEGTNRLAVRLAKEENDLAIRLAKEAEEAERVRLAQEGEAERVRLAKEEAERQRQEAERQRRQIHY